MGNTVSTHAHFFNASLPNDDVTDYYIFVVASRGSPSSQFRNKLFHDANLQRVFFSLLSPATLIGLSQTCRALQAAIKGYIQESFDVNRLLRRFFPDPRQFRSLQASTGTIIAGSTALQFFDRSYYPGSDLDLYLPFGSQKAIGEYLLSIGYQFIPYRWQAPTFQEALRRKGTSSGLRPYSSRPIYGSRGRLGSFQSIVEVFTFTRPYDGQKVQLIVAESNPMEVVFNFHSSEFKTPPHPSQILT